MLFECLLLQDYLLCVLLCISVETFLFIYSNLTFSLLCIYCSLHSVLYTLTSPFWTNQLFLSSISMKHNKLLLYSLSFLYFELNMNHVRFRYPFLSLYLISLSLFFQTLKDTSIFPYSSNSYTR